MFRNYLKVAWRNIVKHKGYSLINIAGLALGMAVCILILLYVQFERSYDRFHENIAELYFVPTWMQLGEEIIPFAGCPPAVGPALKTDYPDIVNTTRLNSAELPVTYGGNTFKERIRLVDPAFLSMFTFPLVAGDSHSALTEPYSIVLTEKTADKYFGDEDPLGKTLRLGDEYDFEVTGVTENVPGNSTFRFDFLAPLTFARELYGENYIDTWYNCSFYTVAQLRIGADYQEINQKIAGRIKASLPEANLEPYLFPLADIHLHSITGEGGPVGQVNMFFLIALGILLVACINFMNLTTARAGSRSREVGMRKVIGAQRGALIRQFFGESMLHALLAIVVAIGLVELLLPAFRALTGRPLELAHAGNSMVALYIAGIALLAGLISGSYPALFLSSLRPVRVLKGASTTGRGASWFRRVLVVGQFALSVALIIGTLVVYNQHDFMLNKDLGFDKEHLLGFPLNFEAQQNYESIRQELLQHPAILQATMSSHSLSGVYWNGSGWNWPGKDAETDPLVTSLGVDFDYLETFGMKLVDGDFFSRDFAGRIGRHVVINETFARIIGLESPVGERLWSANGEYTILGVVQDFHFQPVNYKIGPLMMYYRPHRNYTYVWSKIDPSATTGAIAHIKEVWAKFYPDQPFEYQFLDQELAGLYTGVRLTGQVLRYFAALAIFISCLGLFGLASFMAEQRTKEIGIRKVLGASIPRIIRMLSHEFILQAVIANVIAWPIIYYLMSRWLEDFTYRTGLGWLVFVLSGAATLLIILLTVGYQAVKVAVANPVEALKYE